MGLCHGDVMKKIFDFARPIYAFDGGSFSRTDELMRYPIWYPKVDLSGRVHSTPLHAFLADYHKGHALARSIELIPWIVTGRNPSGKPQFTSEIFLIWDDSRYSHFKATAVYKEGTSINVLKRFASEYFGGDIIRTIQEEVRNTESI